MMVRLRTGFLLLTAMFCLLPQFLYQGRVASPFRGTSSASVHHRVMPSHYSLRQRKTSLSTSFAQVEDDVKMNEVRDSGESFADYIPMASRVIECLGQRGIRVPTPIQSASLNRIYEGESAILHAETGSGKSLAFLLPAISRMEDTDTMLVVAPTRELAVQLAAEASKLVEDPDSVQLIVPGAKPLYRSLKDARVIVGTPEEIMSWSGRKEGEGVEIRDLDFLRSLRFIVLDEVDFLLPTKKFYGPRAKKMKIKHNRWGNDQPAAERFLSKFVFPANIRPELQVICASATIGREVKMKVLRVLRKDPLGRFQGEGKELGIIRPEHVLTQDLSTAPRAVTVPSPIQHKILTVADTSVSTGAVAAVEASLETLKPSSALVFICPSSGLSVAKAVKQLNDLGVEARSLHEALGWAKGLKYENSDKRNTTGSLRTKHQQLSQQFTASSSTPVVVTFEAMSRGLHFDAVDVVYIIGRPANHKMYLHLAGRTGRYPVLEGTVVTVCTKGDGDHLKSWKRQLGGIEFEMLDLPVQGKSQ
mmetsp:Transcript_12342/g.18413  ORF Transcript_12342/g.18413 Transcript_12342/m.18413 type:complete len:532 (+) Transcript_12342:63-1658(+)